MYNLQLLDGSNLFGIGIISLFLEFHQSILKRILLIMINKNKTKEFLYINLLSDIFSKLILVK